MAGPRPLRSTDPRRIGGYELLARLGEGGQGTVYLARGSDGVQVAVKLLRAEVVDDPQARRFLERELTAVSRVAPFCTARILAFHADDDAPHLVSEYVAGPSLQERVLESGPFSGAALTTLAIGTATALAAIHQAGVVHRDFKPANVLLGPDGPRVIDFGVARPLDATTATVSQAVGTPAYMSPEQLAGDRAGPPMDLFAWGCTMVFAATGRTAFPGATAPSVINRILSGEPDLGALSGPVRDLAAACLAKDPAARPAATDLLLRLLGEAPHDGLLAEGASAAATLTSTPPGTSTPEGTPAHTPPLPYGPSADAARPYAPAYQADTAVPPGAAVYGPYGPGVGTDPRGPGVPPPYLPYGPGPVGSPTRTGRRALAVGAAAGGVLLVAAGVTAVVLLNGKGKAASASPPPGKATQSTAAQRTAAQRTGVAAGTTTCTYSAAGATGGSIKRTGTPPAKPALSGTVHAVLSTSRGVIQLSLDATGAPCTVNSFAYLARSGFYDKTACHRLTTVADLKVLQCGDPSGTGSGGPSYVFGNENLGAAAYTRGTVAMANTGAEVSNGSQFFILYGVAAGLPKTYTVFGHVTSGLDVVDKVAAGGTDGSNGTGDGRPKLPISILSVRI